MAKNEEMDAAREVARMVKAEGGRALLVGGCVRDALMGGEPKDIDVECFGIAPDRLRAILSERFALDLVGASIREYMEYYDVDDVYIITCQWTSINGPVFSWRLERFLDAVDAGQ